MAGRSPAVDDYIAKAQPFARPILTHIRKAVHKGCPGVEEELKWRHPAFMYKGILAGMAAHKEHVTFGFWKAAAMNDRLGGKAAEAAGQFGRIASVDDLPNERELAAMVKEAAALHDGGIKAPRKKTAPKAPLDAPDDFLAALKKNKKARQTYDAFSPSHKREYLEWILEAKRDETRAKRVASAVEWMAEGKPRNWKYM